MPRGARDSYGIPCFWWEGCHVTPSVIVAEDERYCKPHGRQAADMEARRFVMARDLGTCQRCGGFATDTMHLVATRSARYVRHEPANLAAGCRECHAWLDNHPTLRRLWIEDKYGPERLTRIWELEAAGERRGNGVDLAAVIRGFREYALTPEEMRTFRSGAWLRD